MAITNATRVADFGSGIGTEGAVLQVDNTNNRLGVGTTNPQAMLQVGTGVSVYGNSGIVSATSFFGDGANLTNVGVDTSTLVSDQVFVVGVATVGSAVTINSTGIDAVSGVITASSFVGNVTGNCSGSSGSATGTAGGLTGTPDITVRNITGVAATFTGVLTYEDVTNVDSVGIVTARGGFEIGAAGVGGTITSVGNAQFTGIATATQFVGILTGGTASGATVGVGTTSTILGVTDGATQNRFSGVLVEKAAIQSNTVQNSVIDLANGNVHYFTTNGAGASVATIKYKGGNNLSAYMKVGENISVSVISKPNNAEYISSITIDGNAVTEEWLGGSVPSAASGAASSYTITNINITRFAATGTPNSDYLVLASVNNYA